jgi:hypothetical protein
VRKKKMMIVMMRAMDMILMRAMDMILMIVMIRRFTKMMSKQKFFKRDKKGKFRSKTKRACYNYRKYGHYIGNCPHDRRQEEGEKR